MQPHSRFDFGHFVDRVFWGLITGAVIYSASQMEKLGASVNELNKNMAVVIEKILTGEKRIDRLEDKVFRK